MEHNGHQAKNHKGLHGVPVLGLDHVQIAIPAGSEDAARGFYSGILGLKEIPKPAELAGRGGVWFACGSLQLHLGVEHDFHPAKKAHPALLVDNLNGMLEKLSKSGCEVKPDTPLQGRQHVYTEDPFGNRVELISQY